MHMDSKDDIIYKSFDGRIEIPTQLQIEGFKFCKVEKGDKKPFESGWAKNGYKWNDPDFQAWIENGGNYGVLGGHGDLVIFDADDLLRLQELGIIDALPVTFTVETPGRHGWHLYFKCPGLEKKAALYDPERTDINNKGITQYVHVADLVSFGMQAVGPNSRRFFPKEDEKVRPYRIVGDTEIAEIDLAQLQDAIKFLRTSPKVGKKTKPRLMQEKSQKDAGRARWANTLRVEDVLLPDNIVRDDLDNSGELQGAHPIHGSTSGKNFSININKNTWYCHRCKCGGGPWELLGIKEGIITCDQSYKGWKRDHPELWTQVLEKAREYGIKVPNGPFGESSAEIRRECIRYAIEVLEGSEHIKCLGNNDLILWNGKYYEYFQNMPNKGETDIRAMSRKLMGNFAANHMINEVVGYFKDQPRVLITDFDKQRGQIAVENGMLDMETQELKPHAPEVLVTSCIPIEWNPEADTSLIDKWMEWFQPDEDTRDYLWKLLGATVAGTEGLQLFHILYGEQGNNGKDTLLQIISEILGRQAWTTSVGTFVKDRFGKDKSFSLAELEGKKAIMATEAERGSILAEAAVKLLTGSTINAREPYGRKEKNFSFDGTAILATNHLPKIQGGITRPIRRRLRIIDCPSTLTGHGTPNYHKVLIEMGGQGLLRRIMEGYQAYLREGLDPSEQMDRDLMEYIKEEDPLMGFVDSCLEFTKDETDILSTGEIFEAWRSFLVESGMGEIEDKTKIRKWFGQTLAGQIKQREWRLSKKQGSGTDRGKTVYIGLKLRMTSEEELLGDYALQLAQGCSAEQEEVLTV
jgi:P4 family phage/plasmid primase-like protien